MFLLLQPGILGDGESTIAPPNPGVRDLIISWVHIAQSHWNGRVSQSVEPRDGPRLFMSLVSVITERYHLIDQSHGDKDWLAIIETVSP